MAKDLSIPTDTKLNRRGARRASEASGPRRPRRRLSPDARRAELLGTALGVFARRGIGRATHAEVAAEAGCSLATAFVYFPTREELVAAVLEEIERFYAAMLHPEKRRQEAAPATIRSHVEAFTASVSDQPDHARIWLEWSTAIREDIWPRYLAFQERIVAALAETIERGRAEGTISSDIDAEDAARLLIGAAHMLAQMKFSGQPSEKISHFIRTLMATAFGIGP